MDRNTNLCAARQPVVLCVLATLALAGCKENAAIDHNLPPIANAGADMMLDYSGSPVSVVLDGSGSQDEDGEIVGYRWESGNDADDAGAVAGPNPDDVVSPSVTLEEGKWSFNLWVTDNGGSISAPATVVITVGNPAPPPCVPADCPTPGLGEACCTSDDTGTDPGDFRGRGPSLCGADVGSVIPDLAGVCLQTDQPGTENMDCPEVMGTTALEPGCCTDEGLCGGVNALVGCHYPMATGAGDACTP